jgi:hypothetical protein
MRKPCWGCTINFYFGSASIEFDRAMRILGGIGIRTNFRIYGKRYWAWKKKMKRLRERMHKQRTNSQRDRH